MPSPPISLPSPIISYNQPLTPLSDNNQPNNQSHTSYRLRQSPTHSAKFIESTTLPIPIMAKDTPKRKSIKRKASSNNHLQDENNNQMSNEPLKLRLSVKESSSSSQPAKRKRGRPRVSNKDLEEEELFYKTFGNKLTKAEANTTRGTPSEADIATFEKARLKAEVNTELY